MYAMQRANGDWFALDDDGRLRVPVFYSSSEAMQARGRSFEMLLFKPVLLDERALKDLAQPDGETAAGFWLVDDPTVKLVRGRPLEHAQLALLIRDAAPTAQI
jgi:hypothetical protein